MKKAQKIAENRLKPNQDFYKWCISHFPIYAFRKSGQIIQSHDRCSKDNRRVIERQIRSNTNFSKLYEEKIFVIVLATKRRIEIQSYIFWQDINSQTLKESIDFKLWNIELFESNKHHKVCYYPYFKGYGEGLRSSGDMTGPYTYAQFYKQDYEQVFKRSELRHFNMNELFDIHTIRRLYKYRLGLEHIFKKNNRRLFQDIIDGKADMRRVTKKFIRKYDRLVRLDFDCESIAIYELIKNHSSAAKPNLKAIELLGGNHEILSKHLDRSQFNRLQNYLLKQNQTLRYYDDYIKMLADIGNETEDDIVLFPRNLVAEHDKLVEIVNALENERKTKLEAQEAKKMSSITRRLKSYEYKGANYQVVAPNDLQDIVNEGIALSHCVGTSHYLNNHKTGAESIMFVRKSSDRDSPFYTMTYIEKKNSVTQIHGYSNEETEEDPLIKKFINDEWLPYVRKEKEKQSAKNIKRSKQSYQNKKRLNEYTQTAISY